MEAAVTYHHPSTGNAFQEAGETPDANQLHQSSGKGQTREERCSKDMFFFFGVYPIT